MENSKPKDNENLVTLQANKINALLEDCERIGADKFDLLLRLNQIAKEISCSPPEIENRLKELLSWEKLGKTKLGPNIPHAENHLENLFSYAKDLHRPSIRLHRAISKALNRTVVGRSLSNISYSILALIKCK